VPPRTFTLKLSQGSLLLLHLAAAGHVWRDERKGWVASTERNKRVVDERIKKMIDQGVLSATYQDNFPKVTARGQLYMDEHPIEGILQRQVR